MSNCVKMIDLFGQPMMFKLGDNDGKYHTTFGGCLTISALLFLLLTAAYDLDAYFKDSEPYIKIVTGLISPENDFKNVNYYR